MSRKLITFLGTGPYKEAIYYENKEEINGKSFKSRFIQEVLAKKLGENLEVIVCLTKGARKINWEDTENNYGLKSRLDKSNIKYKELDIEDGKNDKEIWSNFDKIYEVIDNNDEIYIDITHSFRSIPIIFMAVINFAREMKNISVEGIYYGAYEAKEDIILNEKKEEIAPILNLNLFDSLAQWSRAAERFISTGDARLIAEEVKKGLKPIVKDKNNKYVNEARALNKDIPKLLTIHSENLLSCRGKNVADDGLLLKNKLKVFTNIDIQEIKPFLKIMEKLYDSVKGYTGNLIEDFIFTVDLCNKYGLIQQGFTFLQEAIITFITMELGFDYKERANRIVATKILTSFAKEENNLSQDEMILKIKLNNDIFKKLSEIYGNIADYRNDLNHSGFRQDSHKYNSFKERLAEYNEDFKNIYNEYSSLNKVILDKKRAVVILSHELNCYQILELKEKWKVSDIIFLPKELKDIWSSINPNGEIDTNYLNSILKFIVDNTNEDDYVIVQGEFGATHYIVNRIFENNRIPLYATTVRKVKEMVIDNITKTERVFEHVNFRKYLN